MSFLNPVSEPVKRFSSTDAGAPQINYNSRVAGDVKTVLKACLVVGYGDKASAGWSIANEVDHVAEFVSPSAAMSDYRLGIDDTSASSTTWYYQYQGLRTNPDGNALSKTDNMIDKTSVLNGWDLLVTDLGLYLIFNIKNIYTNSVASTIMYFGATKSAVNTVDSKNIAWWLLGWGNSGVGGRPSSFFASNPNSNSQTVRLGDIAINGHQAIGIDAIKNNTPATSNAIGNIDVLSHWYFSSDSQIVAQQPGVLLRAINQTNTEPKNIASTIDGRAVLGVWAARSASNISLLLTNSRVVLYLYTDYWGY